MFFNIFSKKTIQISTKEKIKKTFVSYILTILGCLISIFFIEITDLIITKSLHYPSVKDLFHQSRIRIDKFGILKIAILVPFIEEILFRLFLVPSKNNLKISISFIIFFIINKGFFFIDFYNYKLYLSITLIIIANQILVKKYNEIYTFIKGNQKLLITTSILLFGLVHISNIDTFYWQLSLFYPIYVIPQIIMGYFITNLRLKAGFIWGVTLHVIINFISSIIFN